MTIVALLDLSGWARFEHRSLGQERGAEIADRLRFDSEWLAKRGSLN